MISSGVCTEGCKDGFYPKTSGGCAECHTNCLTCKAIDLCTACKQSLNLGSICQYDCTGCNNNCDANSGCSNGCSGSSFQFYNDEKNGYECKSCPSACSPCNDQSPCKLCKPGHFGNTCSQQCRPECLTCTGYDDCQSCTNGHRGTACSRQSCNTTNGACFDACKDVWFDDKCSTCKSNRFHQDDSKKICDCTNEYCKSYIRETCTECTLDTWYPKGRGCCPCSSNCLNSLCQNDGSCTECETGKHGTHCNEVCAYGCYNNICHRNGTCVSCRYGRYGPTCNLFCSGTINYCNVCFGQDRNDLACTRCYDYMNRYADGQQCKVCSSNCKPRSRQSCNTTNGACFGGCKDGWFGDKCETKCSVQNCENCSDTDPHECEECTAGFYLNANRACNECPSNCKEGTACNKYSGVCEEGCYNGFSGGHFNITCLPGCRQCDQNDTSSCNVCKYTFYGQSCELPCNLGCVTQNQSQICNKLYGTCDFGCKDGLWDNQCDKPCGVCSKTACNRRTGNCLSPCHDTHYGKACNSQCNENCVNTTGRTCDETDGNCLDGCQVGWFGQQCYNECGQNCKGRICDRNNGSCTSGCIDGYTGSMCSQGRITF